MLLDFLVTSTARKDLLKILWLQNVSGSVRELARLSDLAPSAVARELARMERLGLVETGRVGSAKVSRANQSSPHASLLKRLLSSDHPGHLPESENVQIRAWLAGFGAPLLVATEVKGGADVPALEEVLVRALHLSHWDASLARSLPVVLWRNRHRLELGALVHGSLRANEGQALGFFLELTGLLSGEAGFSQAAESLRDKRHRRETFFFRDDEASELSKELARVRAPEVARRWNFVMNMPLDSFESLFRKAASLDGSVQPGPARAVSESGRSRAGQPSATHRDRRRRGGPAVRRKAKHK
jgi:hypothetical protein